jgi:hypothetical protein
MYVYAEQFRRRLPNLVILSKNCPVVVVGPYRKCKKSWPLESKARRSGRAIAQAVSRWLPTAAAGVRSRVWSGEICGGQSGAGAGFLRVLRFLLPIFIPPNSPSS